MTPTNGANIDPADNARAMNAIVSDLRAHVAEKHREAFEAASEKVMPVGQALLDTLNDLDGTECAAVAIAVLDRFMSAAYGVLQLRVIEWVMTQETEARKN